MGGRRGGWKGRQGLDCRGGALGARLRSWVSFFLAVGAMDVFSAGGRPDLLCSALEAMGRRTFGEERPLRPGCCFGLEVKKREEWKNHFRGIHGIC